MHWYMHIFYFVLHHTHTQRHIHVLLLCKQFPRLMMFNSWVLFLSTCILKSSLIIVCVHTNIRRDCVCLCVCMCVCHSACMEPGDNFSEFSLFSTWVPKIKLRSSGLLLASGFTSSATLPDLAAFGVARLQYFSKPIKGWTPVHSSFLKWEIEPHCN